MLGIASTLRMSNSVAVLYVAFSIAIIKCNPFAGNRISISIHNLIFIFL